MLGARGCGGGGGRDGGGVVLQEQPGERLLVQLRVRLERIAAQNNPPRLNV